MKIDSEGENKGTQVSFRLFNYSLAKTSVVMNTNDQITDNLKYWFKGVNNN